MKKEIIRREIIKYILGQHSYKEAVNFSKERFEYNVSKGYPGYIGPYKYLVDADLSLNDREKSLDFVAKFKKLYAQMNAPDVLSNFKVTESTVEFLAGLTFTQRNANLQLNPVHFGKEEVISLLRKVI